VGGSTLSAIDPATGAARVLGAVGGEIGVLGIAVTSGGRVAAITDAPTVLELDPDDPAAAGAGVPVDAGGSTLLAVAAVDTTMLAIGDDGRIVELDPATGATAARAQLELTDPGVGLDLAPDGTLEVVVATGDRWSVDVGTGTVTALPPVVPGARLVALAHSGSARLALDASTDSLVALGADGAVTPIGPVGFDVTDGASLAVDDDGRVLAANPG
jgi:hypothetical protein